MSPATPNALLTWLEDWVRSVPKSPDVVLVRGDGPHLDALRARWPGAILVALDRDAQRPARELTLIERDPVLFQARARRALAARLDVWRCAPPDERLDAAPGESEFQQLIGDALRQAELEQGTLQVLGPLWLSNLQQNLATLAASASIQNLGLPWRGCAVLVAGAGPSLSTIVRELRPYRQRTIVLAASSALRPLWKHGIVPDAVAIIEARDCSHHFDAVPLEVLPRITLIAASHTHPSHWNWPWATRVSFHGPVGSWLVPWTGRSTLIPTAGNVGTTMLVLAWMLGGFPVMAAGLDFALDRGAYYATHAGSRAEEHRHPSRYPVTGWQGETLEATPELIAYREGTELALKHILRGDPAARFLSVTGRGARVRGMNPAPWVRIAPELPMATRDGLSRAASPATARPPAPHTIDARVQARLDEAERDLKALQSHPGGTAFGVVSSSGHSPLSELVIGIGRHQPPELRDRETLQTLHRLREAWNAIASATVTSV